MDRHSCSLSTCTENGWFSQKRVEGETLEFSQPEKRFCSVNCTSSCSYKSKGSVCLLFVCF